MINKRYFIIKYLYINLYLNILIVKYPYINLVICKIMNFEESTENVFLPDLIKIKII